MHIIKNFISLEDVKIIQDYISTVDFNTRDSHVPLHNDLYEKYNAPFDLHTRGEMPKYILDIFSKYSENLYNLVNSIGDEYYMPPMFSKHYIARYLSGKSVTPQFDSSKPKDTYRSIIFWNNDFLGGELVFPNIDKIFRPDPGDLVLFLDSDKFKVGITEISGGNLYMSEAWVGKPGQLWMPSSVPYDEIEWDNWEIRGF